MLVTIDDRDGKSAPASQRGICCISAIGMGSSWIHPLLNPPAMPEADAQKQK
jgi:hypothetical protein